MALKRIMPCLLYDGQGLVKTVNFKKPKYVGDPINAIKIFNEKEVDELVLLDIGVSKGDHPIDFDMIAKCAAECFMPLAYGGGVKKFEAFQQIFGLGVEKIIVNSALMTAPEVIKQVVDVYGSQSLVASIDVKKNLLGKYKPYSHSGLKIPYSLEDYCTYVQELGVGEVLITSVEEEGTWNGLDHKLITHINALTKTPVIGHGGAGSIDDIKKALYETGTNAVALGSMSVYQKKGMGVLINFPQRNTVIKDG